MAKVKLYTVDEYRLWDDEDDKNIYYCQVWLKIGKFRTLLYRTLYYPSSAEAREDANTRLQTVFQTLLRMDS